MIKYICHDCKRELKNGEEFMSYREDLIKCKGCHEKNPVLKNFQACEIFSRVCGYYRPISQWNPGKISEWKDRIVYKIRKK